MDSKIIRIVNLDDKTTEQSLKQFIEQYLSLHLNGSIKSVYVRKDEVVNLVFAYVVFEYAFTARIAVERLAGYYYNTFILEVELIGPSLKCKNYHQLHSALKENISPSKWSSSRTSPQYIHIDGINTPNQEVTSVSSNSTSIQFTRHNAGYRGYHKTVPANSNSPVRNPARPTKQFSSSAFSPNKMSKLMEIQIDKPTTRPRPTLSADSTSTTNQYVNKPTIRSETVNSNSTSSQSARPNVRYPNRQRVSPNFSSPAQNNSPTRQSSSSGISSNTIPKLMQTSIDKPTTSLKPINSTSTNTLTNQYLNKPTIRSETVSSNSTSSQWVRYPAYGQSVPANSNSSVIAQNTSSARQSSSSGFSSNTIPKLMQTSIDKPTTSLKPINSTSTNTLTNQYVNKPTIRSETVNSNSTSSQSARYTANRQSVSANSNYPAQNSSSVRQSLSSGFSQSSNIPINKPTASTRPILSTNSMSTNTSTNQYVNNPINKSQTVTSIRPNIELIQPAYETRTSNYNYPGTTRSNYTYNSASSSFNTLQRTSTVTNATKKKESNCVIS